MHPRESAQLNCFQDVQLEKLQPVPISSSVNGTKQGIGREAHLSGFISEGHIVLWVKRNSAPKPDNRTVV